MVTVETTASSADGHHLCMVQGPHTSYGLASSGTSYVWCEMWARSHWRQLPSLVSSPRDPGSRAPTLGWRNCLLVSQALQKVGLPSSCWVAILLIWGPVCHTTLQGLWTLNYVFPTYAARGQNLHSIVSFSVLCQGGGDVISDTEGVGFFLNLNAKCLTTTDLIW